MSVTCAGSAQASPMVTRLDAAVSDSEEPRQLVRSLTQTTGAIARPGTDRGKSIIDRASSVAQRSERLWQATAAPRNGFIYPFSRRSALPAEDEDS